MAKHRTARTIRTRIQDSAKAKLLNLVRSGVPVRVAAGAAGIGKSTIYDHIGKDPVFAKLIEEAQQTAHSRRIALIERAAEKDWKAAAWMLERTCKEEFTFNQRVELSPHKDLSDDELARRLERAAAELKGESK